MKQFPWLPVTTCIMISLPAMMVITSQQENDGLFGQQYTGVMSGRYYLRYHCALSDYD